MRYEKTLLPKKNDTFLIGVTISSIFFVITYTIVYIILFQEGIKFGLSLSKNLSLFLGASLFPFAIISSVLFSSMISVNVKFKKTLLNRLGFIQFKRKHLYLTPCFFVATIATLIIVNISTTSIFKFFDWNVEPQSINEMIMNADLTGMILMGFCIIVLAPIFEEILFRRALFSSLLPITNIYVASIITSIIFALMHFDSLVTMPSLFVLALILQTLYVKYRSIYPAIFLHSFNNAFAFIMILLVKYQEIPEKIIEKF